MPMLLGLRTGRDRMEGRLELYESTEVFLGLGSFLPAAGGLGTKQIPYLSSTEQGVRVLLTLIQAVAVCIRRFFFFFDSTDFRPSPH
jgi:hypothetical protein